MNLRRTGAASGTEQRRVEQLYFPFCSFPHSLLPLILDLLLYHFIYFFFHSLAYTL